MFVPNRATGIVITETTINIHRQAGNPALPASDSSNPDWIQLPVMLPRWPKQQNSAARVPSSDLRYQDPRVKWAPTLKIYHESKKRKERKVNKYYTHYAIAEKHPSKAFNSINCQTWSILYVMSVKTLQVTFAATKTYFGRASVRALVPGIWNTA